MGQFLYKAMTADGKFYEDVLVADSEEEAIHKIKSQSLFPIEIQVLETQQRKVSAQQFRFKPRQIAQFTSQLHTLLKAGVPILASLKAIRHQSRDETFREFMNVLIQDVAGGSSLSSAMEKHPRVFSRIYVNAIRVGEISGTLEETLHYLHRLLEDEYRIKKDVQKALRYPLITLVAIIVAFFIFTTLVIPKFAPLFEASGTELPFITRLLLSISAALTQYGWLVVLGILGTVGGILYAYRLEEGRYHLESFLFTIPIFGALIQKSLMARFTKMLYTLFHTGIPLVQALEIIRSATENRVFRREIDRMIQGVKKGEGLAATMEKSRIFDEFAVQMIRIGEESGAIEGMLSQVADYYDREVTETVSNLSTVVEPVLTVILGAMVFILAMALLLPMWDLISMMK
ncbi:MAG: type II secretion system F family protein [Calditrichaeota bacterium]|nr:type II secretion system F family protein [Calditrichota bacterium]